MTIMSHIIRRPLLLTFQIEQIQCRMFSTVRTSSILASRFQKLKLSEGTLVKKSLIPTFSTTQWYSTAQKIVKPPVDSAMKSVSIKELFEKYQREIDTFKEDKPEVYKVLKYIMNSDVKVMKAQADTIEISFAICHDLMKVIGGDSQLKNSGIKVGNFSKAMWGKDSEASRILKAFLDLKNEAQIVDEKQVIQDFEDLLYEQRWACAMLGCYLSKYLETPRLALKVFEQLTSSVLYKSGKFSKKENDFILQHIKSKNGEYDLNYLKLKLMRPRSVIQHRIEEYLVKPSLKQDEKFTLDEDIEIVKHVFSNGIPKEIEEVQHICSGKISWKSLEPKIKRKRFIIEQRWQRIIYPRILAHLHGTMHLDLRREFFQYVIDNKFVSVVDIDKEIAKERWPSIPQRKLCLDISSFAGNKGKKGVPLHQNLSENIHRLRPCKPSQETLDFIDAFKNLSH